MIFYGRHKGIPVVKTILENEFLHVETMNLGASLLVFREKYSGRDIVLGSESVTSYLEFSPYYLGASVGRCANRIAEGRFSLQGREYRVSLNNPPHSLHGGDDGFHLKVFAVKEAENEVIYSLVSADGEAGYPGKLEVQVRYLLEGKALYWEVTGSSDQDTLFNMTNHSYFNLLGSNGRTVIAQRLSIPSDKVGFVDSTGLAQENLQSVEGSVFDFRRKKKIGEVLKSKHPNLCTAGGLDHPYIFEREGLRACLESTDLSLKVFSDYPSMHLYSGNYLPGTLEGKNGYSYGAHDGICFECQFYPNAVNYPTHASPVLKKGEIKRHYIKYLLERTSS